MDNEEVMADDEVMETEAGKPDESKADKFHRLATGRMNKILKDIKNLGNLSSRSSYEYTEEEVEKMFAAIQKEVDGAHTRFKPAEKKDEGFSF